MAILSLSQLEGWRLADPSRDLRGLPLVDSSGSTLGTIVELKVNTRTDRVEFVVLSNGEAYPVSRLERERDAVRLGE